MQGPREYRPVGYRWVVLAVVMAANAGMQSLWIAYAPVTEAAKAYYGVDETLIGLFSMAFMIVFVPLSLPASWLIDARGPRFAVTLGAVLAAVGGVARGLVGANWWAAFAATVLVAIAQPLLMNAWTSIAAIWFPQRQRATAVSLITLANLVGTAAALLFTPSLARALGIAGTQLAYGAAMAAAALAVAVFMRARPPRPADPDHEHERALMLDGLRHALRLRPFVVTLAVAFVLLGTFNGVTTWVEEIVLPDGLSSDDAGLIGAVMLAAGLVGAVVLSTLSDRSLHRIRYVTVGLVGAAPGILGLAFARTLGEYVAAAAVTGFFLVGALPVGMQYGAEITRPTPEGTSNGLLQLAGQAAVVVVGLMAVTRTADGAFTPSLIGLAVVVAVLAVVVRRLPEPVHRPTPARSEAGQS